MFVSQSSEETTRDRILRWISIAEDHAQRDESYTLYPGDWAALANVLSKALKEIDLASYN